jgi:hypothetical protein
MAPEVLHLKHEGIEVAQSCHRYTDHGRELLLLLRDTPGDEETAQTS